MKKDVQYKLKRIHKMMLLNEATELPSVGGPVVPKNIYTTSIGHTLEDLGVLPKEVEDAIKSGGLAEPEKLIWNFKSYINKSFDTLQPEEYQFVSDILRKFFPDKFKKYSTDLENLLNQAGTGIYEKLTNDLKSGGITPKQFYDYVYQITHGKTKLDTDVIRVWTDFLKNKPIALNSTTGSGWKKLFISLGYALLNAYKKGLYQPLYEVVQGIKKEIAAHPLIPSSLFFKKLEGQINNYATLVEPLEKKMETQYQIIAKKLAENNYNLDIEIAELNRLMLEYNKIEEANLGQIGINFMKHIEANTDFKEFTDKNGKLPLFRNYNAYDKQGQAQYNLFRQIVRAFEGGNAGSKEFTISKVEGFLRLFGKGYKNTTGWQKIGNTLQRAAGIIISYSPRTFKEEAQNFNALGWKKWFFGGVGQKIGFAVFYVGPMWALTKTAGDMYLALHNRDLPPEKRKTSFLNISSTEDYENIEEHMFKVSYVTSILWHNYTGSLKFFGTDGRKLEAWSYGASKAPVLFEYWDEIDKSGAGGKLPDFTKFQNAYKQADSELNATIQAADTTLSLQPNLVTPLDTMGARVPTQQQVNQLKDSLSNNMLDILKQQ